LQVTENGKTKDVGKGHAALVNGPDLKTAGFDRNAEDDLYRWSRVMDGDSKLLTKNEIAEIFTAGRDSYGDAEAVERHLADFPYERALPVWEPSRTQGGKARRVSA